MNLPSWIGKKSRQFDVVGTVNRWNWWSNYQRNRRSKIDFNGLDSQAIDRSDIWVTGLITCWAQATIGWSFEIIYQFNEWMKNQAILTTADPSNIHHMVAKWRKNGVKSLFGTCLRHQDHHEDRTNYQHSPCFLLQVYPQNYL